MVFVQKCVCILNKEFRVENKKSKFVGKPQEIRYCCRWKVSKNVWWFQSKVLSFYVIHLSDFP